MAGFLAAARRGQLCACAGGRAVLGGGGGAAGVACAPLSAGGGAGYFCRLDRRRRRRQNARDGGVGARVGGARLCARRDLSRRRRRFAARPKRDCRCALRSVRRRRRGGLLARQSGAPVAAGIDRFAGAQLLIEKRGCDVVIGDDGMQHYALARDFEICVVGGFGFGNRLPLPAGPLREPMSRLRRCDALALVDGASAAAPPARAFEVETRLGAIYNPRAPERAVAAESFAAADTALLAGIADPESFSPPSNRWGFRRGKKSPAPDHCRYRASDLRAIAAAKIITTEKDAVKCERFDDARIFALPRIAVLPPSLVDAAAAAIEKARAARRIDR